MSPSILNNALQSAIATEQLLEPIRRFATYIQIMEISTGILTLASSVSIFASMYLHAKSNNWNFRRMIGKTS